VKRHEILGVDVYLYCNLPNDDNDINHKSQKFIWRTKNFQIKSNPFKYTLFANVLIIRRFDSYDIGTYKCQISNGLNKKRYQSMVIHLEKASKFKIKSNVLQN
jgi:hypothetical protein